MSQNVNCHNKVYLSSGRPLIETHQDSISVYLSETNLLSRSFESLLCCLTLQFTKWEQKCKLWGEIPRIWLKPRSLGFPLHFHWATMNEMCSIKINQIFPGIRIFLLSLDEISDKVGDGCCPIFFWPQQKKWCAGYTHQVVSGKCQGTTRKRWQERDESKCSWGCTEA